MAGDREYPLVARNFQVAVVILGPRGGYVSESDVSCSGVVLPRFRLDDHPARDDVAGRAEPGNLVLRRGHTGSSTFYEWWRAERDGERDRVREVTVVLLDEARKPATSWKFTGCRVVGLDYSTLDALAPEVVIESLELSITTIEQRSAER